MLADGLVHSTRPNQAAQGPLALHRYHFDQSKLPLNDRIRRRRIRQPQAPKSWGRLASRYRSPSALSDPARKLSAPSFGRSRDSRSPDSIRGYRRWGPGSIWGVPPVSAVNASFLADHRSIAALLRSIDPFLIAELAMLPFRARLTLLFFAPFARLLTLGIYTTICASPPSRVPPQ